MDLWYKNGPSPNSHHFTSIFDQSTLFRFIFFSFTTNIFSSNFSFKVVNFRPFQFQAINFQNSKNFVMNMCDKNDDIAFMEIHWKRTLNREIPSDTCVLYVIVIVDFDWVLYIALEYLLNATTSFAPWNKKR